MCLSSPKASKNTTPTPAAAPAPPIEPPEEQEIGKARKTEEDLLFGDGPKYRVDRAVSPAATAGGTGIKMG